MPGKLFLLPNLLDESVPHELCLPPAVAGAVAKLQGLIAESEKSGRRYLRRFLSHDAMAATPLRLLNEHSKESEIKTLLEPLQRGEIWGLISDAGLACIADPGAALVQLAQKEGIAVETFAGPSSLLMALQLSGFSGQSFTFHGYLPRDMSELEKKIQDVEKKGRESTQIWIEAPYRSAKMLETLKRVLSGSTNLSVAVSLTTANQRVVSKAISEWKSFEFPLEKEPAVFLLSCLLKVDSK